MRRWVRRTALAVAAAALIALAPTGYALAASAGRVSSVTEVPAQPVALVFGAGIYASGDPQPYLKARLDLAVGLYQAGKVKVVLVSGDNRRADYNEPDAMRASLVAACVGKHHNTTHERPQRPCFVAAAPVGSTRLTGDT